MNQYITTLDFVDPMNKKYRGVKLTDFGNMIARSALSMFERHYIKKSYVVMMSANVFSMKEYDQFSKKEYREAFLNIFPSANIREDEDTLSITIFDAFTQFSNFGSANNLFSANGNVSPAEQEIWGEFAKFIKILCDNQIVEVKVRVSSCLPELASTKARDDKADQNGC